MCDDVDDDCGDYKTFRNHAKRLVEGIEDIDDDRSGECQGEYLVAIEVIETVRHKVSIFTNHEVAEAIAQRVCTTAVVDALYDDSEAYSVLKRGNVEIAYVAILDG